MTQFIVRPPARIVLLGGTGFVGRVLARHLDAAGYAVRVLTRREQVVPGLAVLPAVELQRIAGTSVEALAEAFAGAAAVVNLVGILHEGHRGGFDEAHTALTGRVVEAALAAGVPRLVQISALGASAQSSSRYQRSKAAAEELVRASPLAWTILQPSVIYGREDRFLNLFAAMARVLPVLVLPCPEARFQPIHVEDVARAVVRCLGSAVTIGTTLELAGPQVFTLRELARQAGAWAGARPPILGLPPALAMVQAGVMEWLPGGLMSRDNVRSMQEPNVARGPFPAVLGFQPEAMAQVVPHYLHAPAAGTRHSGWRRLAGR